MSSVEEIERRLAQTESGLRAIRQDVQRLTEIDRRFSKRFRATHVGTAVVVATVLIGGRTQNTEAQSPARVRAPFEVVDKTGKAFIRMVEPSASMAGGIYILNDAGNIASMIGFGSGSSSGRVAVYQGDASTGAVRAQATMLFADHPKLIVQTNGKTETGVVADPRNIRINNIKGYASVHLQLQEDGSGQVELGDANGTTVVDAKVTPTNGLGAVLTGPAWGGAMGMTGLPWAIIGKKSR